MTARLENPDEYELVNRESSDEDGGFSLDEADFQSNGTTSTSYAASRRPFAFLRAIIAHFDPRKIQTRPSRTHRRSRTHSHPGGRRRFRWRCPRPSRRCFFMINGLFGVLCAFIVLTAIFRPSYNDPPSHYHRLRERVESSSDYGRANPENQKIFIAASLYDKGGNLLKGAWGEAMLKLLDILGNKNVFLSIYENESEEAAQVAQYQFNQKVQCQHSVVYDKEFSMDEVPTILMPDGTQRVKRMAYLAEMRNKALEPLEEDPLFKYDKLLFLNDVMFDPIDAAQLLLSTNLDAQGHTAYRAACAMDFINPFKFYDTFASRDLEGYSMGLPFFPWFTNAGKGASRQDVLDGKDAVRVKSCWGGMVAFDARPFQAGNSSLKFRATEDLYWDASECCLIHADLIKATRWDDVDSLGIYMNPYIRVAYTTSTLRWLHLTRRVERLYSFVHNLINHLVGLPWFNPRRTEKPGEAVEEKVWLPDTTNKAGGAFHFQTREATGDGFCGIRMLQLIKESAREGEKNWEKMPVPPG